VPDIVAIETANVEKISTKIIDMISTAPRQNSLSDLFVMGAIFSPPGKHPIKRFFNNLYDLIKVYEMFGTKANALS
jgi:hypothetical protein